MGNGDQHEALEDLLLDMRHELGKYIVMPVAMLPAGADPRQLRDAAERALLRTRSRGEQAVGAEALWEGYLRDGGEALASLPGFDALRQAVVRALAWRGQIAADAPLDRAALLSDLRAVGEHIGALLRATEGR